MIKEAYPYDEIEEDSLFVFQSEGPQGTVLKIVVLDFEGNDTWNLGFGDWNNGDVNDSVVTNNHDAMRVIRTVANVALEFFTRHPTSILKIDPVDEKRKKLYNLVFQRHFNEIDPTFNVTGWIKNKKEPYSTKKHYDKFELKLK
jgi:hypothetical protein